MWKGQTYTECTTADDDKPWCYVEGGAECTNAIESGTNLGQFYKYCADDQCHKQMEIDELPSMSARTVCEQAGCVYSTDTSDPFKTKRMCMPPAEEEDPCECKDEFYWDGMKYTECSVTEEGGESWCYVKGGAECTDATESTKNQGMYYLKNCGHACDCKEEFMWKGQTYTECTTADDDKPWCYVKDGANCETSTPSLTSLTSESYKYCASDCPSQKELMDLPAMSAQTVCEQAGCEYSTDTSDPFKTMRMCKPKMEEEDTCEGDKSEGCKIPLENMVPFMIFDPNVELKYENLNEMCCESCKLLPDGVCTLDADSYVAEDGECDGESFELHCGEVNCITNPDCHPGDFGLDADMFECDACLMEDTLFKKGSVVKKKADSIMDCYRMCMDNKGMKDGDICKGYSFIEGIKKNCRMFSKNKKTKSKSGVMSGKRNCHPQKGKYTM